MAVAAPVRAAQADATAPDAGRASVVPPARAHRVILACLALFLLYAACSMLNDPRGTLGTDTGGKLASLDAMDRNGGLDPDLGYWAERFDRDGSLHPLYYTRHVGDRWVNLTTLPMPYAAFPLYELGGERAVLVLPMLGSVLAALAARALARRLAPDRSGWWAFWLVGLASPVAMYALDFWEHSLGVAAVLFAGVLGFDVAEGRGGWRASLGAGLLIGLALTMRTEALIYAGVFAAAVVRRLEVRGVRGPRIAGFAVSGAAGAAAALAGNLLLETVTLGGSLRASRAAGTVAAGGANVGQRMNEAATTFVGFNRFPRPEDWLLGALAASAVAYGVWRLSSRDARARVLGAVALGLAALVYMVRFADGLGFVPGLLTASPLAAAAIGLVVGDRALARIALVAAAPLPIVWVFQYSGGAAPQWGARYLLVSGTVLVVISAVRISSAPVRHALAVVALAGVVTAAGVGWLGQRSHAVADSMRSVLKGEDGALISREAHLLREGGAFYEPGRHWLTVTTDRELREAVGIVSEAGDSRLSLVQRAEEAAPVRLGPFRRAGSRRVAFLPGVVLEVVEYRQG